MRKILVIRGGALGDFILTLPVLAALRGRFPGHSLEILGYPSIASLALAGGLADGVSALESPALAGLFAIRDSQETEPTGEAPLEQRRDAPQAALLAPPGQELRAAPGFFANFEIIISYLYDPERIFQSNVSLCSGAKFIAGPHRPDEALKTHATEQLLRPLEVVGIHDADACPRLTLPAQANRVEGDWLALHPGSGSEQKNWPELKWKELLELLALETKWNFLLIGGEAEGSRCQRLGTVVPPGRAVIAQALPLMELAQKMKSCALFVGHDSGITHLAASLDLPGLALWGASAEITWRPKSDRIKVIRDPRDLVHLPVETVFDAINEQS